MKPEIRFAGFNEAWERRMLGELCSFAKGRGYSKADLRDTGTPVILYGRLYTRYETQINKVDTFARPIEGSLYSSGGEVIIPASGETAEDIAVASSIGLSGVLLGGDLNVITPSNALDSPFLALGVSNGRSHAALAKRAQGKSVVHIHNKDIAEIDFHFPTIEEQRKISAMAMSLDSLITFHHRKHGKLLIFKKSMLERMFPKDGTLEPEIRFAGFTGPWEQRKLGDMATRVTNMSNNPKLPRVEYEDINSGQGMLNKDLASKKSTKAGIEFQPGDVLYGKLRPYLMNWLYPQFKGIAVGDFWVLRPTDIDGTFLYRLVQSEQFQRNANISTGSKMPRADWTFVTNGNYPVPSSRKEQRLIGITFQHLDNLITLHQRKLEKLETMKSSLLQKMFV